MAIDKAVDSSQLNADLTSVANAIRAKGGTSAQLTFPSGFVSAVQAIPSGGGPSVPTGMEFGTVEVVSDALTLTINHSLGVVPKYAVILAAINGDYADMPSGSGGSLIFADLASDPETGVFDTSLGSNHCRNTVVGIVASNTQFNTTNTYTTYPASMSSTAVTFATGRYYNITFRAGVTYAYLMTK